jgi:hypothetical protein
VLRSLETPLTMDDINLQRVQLLPVPVDHAGSHPTASVHHRNSLCCTGKEDITI